MRENSKLKSPRGKTLKVVLLPMQMHTSPANMLIHTDTCTNTGKEIKWRGGCIWEKGERLPCLDCCGSSEEVNKEECRIGAFTKIECKSKNKPPHDWQGGTPYIHYSRGVSQKWEVQSTSISPLSFQTMFTACGFDFDDDDDDQKQSEYIQREKLFLDLNRLVIN